MNEPSYYLIDTDVLSNIRKGEKMDPRLRSFLSETPIEHLFISIITVGEIVKGIQMQVSKNYEFSIELGFWLQGILKDFADRIVMFDLECTFEWGRLCSELPKAVLEKNHGDVLLAATANAKGLTMLTNNVKDFAGIPRVRLHIHSS